MLPRLVHLGESKGKFCSFPASGGSLANFGILWLAGRQLLSVISGSHSLRVPVSGLECPPFSMTHSYWMRNHSNDLILIGSLQRFYFQTKWRSQTLSGRTSTTSTKTAFNPSQVGYKGLSSAGRKRITSIKLPWGRRVCSQLQQLELPAALLSKKKRVGLDLQMVNQQMLHTLFSQGTSPIFLFLIGHKAAMSIYEPGKRSFHIKYYMISLMPLSSWRYYKVNNYFLNKH